MAFDSTNLHLNPVAPGRNSYMYDAGSDSMATVIADGYFNNTDDAIKLVEEDKVYCLCVDGNMWLKVSAVSTSTGAVTCQFAGGNLPLGTPGTGTAAEYGSMAISGHYEIGTSISTASRYVLPTPYAGAEIKVVKVDSGTQVISFDAGGSGATGVVYDSVGNRRINLQAELEMFHVRGVSATRWRIESLVHQASAVNEGGSVVLVGT